VLCAAAAAIAVVAHLWGALTDTALLIWLIALAAAGPPLVRAARGTFDVFEPVAFVAFGALLLFVARPMYESTVLDYVFIGHDLEPTYDRALVAALVAVVAYQAGYHLARRLRLDRRAPDLPEPVSDRGPTALAMALTALAALCVVAFAVERGSLFEDRGGGFVVTTPFVAQATLFALPAVMLLLATARAAGRRVSPLVALPALVLALIAIPAGNRRYLLPTLLALFMWAYLVRGARPRLVTLAVAGAVLAITVVGPLREFRSGEQSLAAAAAHSITHPQAAFEEILRSQDSSPISNIAMAVDVMGNEVPWRGGREALTSLLLAPVPSELWPDKPAKARTVLIDHWFGVTPSGGCVSQCPVYSLVGDLYADAGLYSLGLGGLLLGALFGALGVYLLRQQGNPFALAGLSMAGWAAFYPWWSGLSMVTVLLILLEVPVLAGAWLASGRVSSPVRLARAMRDAGRRRLWVAAGAIAIVLGAGVALLALRNDEPAPAAEWALTRSGRGQETLRGPDGTPVPVRENALQGYVDTIRDTPGGATVEGWSASVRTHEPAEVVVVFAGDRFVAVASRSDRPDVRRALDAPWIANAGFRASAPPGRTLRERPNLGLRVFSIGGGRAAELPRLEASTLERVGGRLLAGRPGGAPLTVTPGTVAGALEQAELRDGRLLLRGWAVSAREGTPAGRVLVYHKDRLVVETWPWRSRPDVARRRGEAASTSGFVANVPARSLTSGDVARLRVFGGAGERASELPRRPARPVQ
jgi:hypothetical protein